MFAAVFEKMERAGEIVLGKLPCARASVHSGQHARVRGRIDHPIAAGQRIQIAAQTQVAMKKAYASGHGGGPVEFTSRAQQIVDAVYFNVLEELRKNMREPSAGEPAHAGN